MQMILRAPDKPEPSCWHRQEIN